MGSEVQILSSPLFIFADSLLRHDLFAAIKYCPFPDAIVKKAPTTTKSTRSSKIQRANLQSAHQLTSFPLSVRQSKAQSLLKLTTNWLKVGMEK